MKSFKQLLEDIQVGPALEEISYKGYTTKNLHHVPDAAKAFQATITRVQKGTLADTGEVLSALKATDTYMKLNDMHLEQEQDLDSQELEQWLAAHEEAKSALTKIGEFEHHYDYWNSHSAELQYLKANQNMPQEAESVKVDEASKLQGTPVVSLSDFGSKDTTKNKYGQTVPKKLKPNDPRVKMYTEPKKEGVAEGLHNDYVFHRVQSGYWGSTHLDKKVVVKAASKDEAHAKIRQRKDFVKKLRNGDTVSWRLTEGLADDFLAMAKNRNPNARIVTAVQKRKETEELMKKREASGTKPAQAAPTSNSRPLGGHDPKSGRSYSESVESIDELSKTTLGSYIKKRSHDVATQGAATRQHAVDAETARKDQDYDQQRKSMASSDKAFMKGWKQRMNIAKAVDRLTKEEVEETEQIDEISAELKQKYLAAATKKHLQQFLGREKVRDKQELDKRRAAIQKTSKELTGKTHYQESAEIEQIDEALDFKKEAAKHMKDMHDKNSTPANKAYAQKMLQRALEASKMKDKVAATKHYMGEEVSEQKSSLPPHLQKLIKDKQLDKKPMTMVTPSQKEKLKATVKDVTPKGYGPNEEVKTVEEGFVGRETKDGTWRVFKTGQAVAVAGPFKSREEASAWIKKQSMAEEVELDEALDAHDQAMAHKTKADKAMDKNDLESYHMHMSAHHESMGQWHESKGRQSRADKEYEKAEKHHELGVKKATQKNEEVELDEKTLTPAELKKREEVAKAMERKNPNMDKSRKMAIATAVAKRVAEQYDDAE